jgi:hypothetical protein
MCVDFWLVIMLGFLNIPINDQKTFIFYLIYKILQKQLNKFGDIK